MNKLVGFTFLAILMLQLTVAEGFNASNMNIQSPVHKGHTGQNTPNMTCDNCHGFPPKDVYFDIDAVPGRYILCEFCHATPPNSLLPSYGNLIVIHLSRGKNCTTCHNIENIIPMSPLSETGNLRNETSQDIQCESCHTNPQELRSHINGGKYCMNCHGSKMGNISTSATRNTLQINAYAAPFPDFPAKHELLAKAIKEATSAIELEKSNGFDVGDAEKILTQTKKALKESDYLSILKLANQSKSLAFDIDGDGIPNNSDFAPSINNNYIYSVTAIFMIGSVIAIRTGLKQRKNQELERQRFTAERQRKEEEVRMQIETQKQIILDMIDEATKK